MDKTFVSKKGIIIGLLLFLAVGFMILAVIQSATVGKFDYIELVITVPVIVFTLWLWFGTFYRFEEESLLVCTGPLRWHIRYDSITKVKPSRSILSSAALSFDRLAIYKNGRLDSLISPKEKREFLLELQQHCPNAEILWPKEKNG